VTFFAPINPPPLTAAPSKAAPAAPAAGRFPIGSDRTLISIVSELTGYPEEMLGLEMDIEADLGIDSIKRVEILSAMEERMPQLPQVTPDRVGTLKTLGQICDFLCTDKPSAADTAAPQSRTCGTGRRRFHNRFSAPR
jgi:acyl carrier protein